MARLWCFPCPEGATFPRGSRWRLLCAVQSSQSPSQAWEQRVTVVGTPRGVQDGGTPVAFSFLSRLPHPKQGSLYAQELHGRPKQGRDESAVGVSHDVK